MASPRTKRILVGFGFLCAAAFAVLALFAYLLTRDVPFHWEQANRYEAAVTQSKLRFYDEAVRVGENGYIRLSPVEINSYLRTYITNQISTTNTTEATAVEPKTRLKKVGVTMSKTNLVLYSWGETKCLGMPVHFVIERGFDIRRGETNQLQHPPSFMRVGNLEIKPEYWPRFRPILQSLDAPLIERFAWMTNVKTFLITKNELSQRPELRLYNYDPFTKREAR